MSDGYDCGRAAKIWRGERLERMRGSARFEDGRFRNTAKVSPGIKGNPLPILGEFFFGGVDRTPIEPLPVESPFDAWSKPVETGFRATWLGHSTVLLEMDGARVLTDPVFADRASPVSFAGPKRFHPVPATIDELPPIDAVLLSHDHFDHLCTKSVIALAKKGVPIVTSLGVGGRLEHLGIPKELVTDLDWFESAAPSGNVRFHAHPAQHFSGRSVADRNRTLWASWVIESEKHRVFFSGDTGLTPEFSAIGEKHGAFDLVMLEIGAFHPSWGDIHLGPENALEAFRMLGGGTLLPVHWGTFNLGMHPWDEPGEQILEMAAPLGARVLTPRLGRPIEPTRVAGPDPWWREVRVKRPKLIPASV